MISKTENRDGTVDLVIEQGTSGTVNMEMFSDAALTDPLDLSPYSIRGQARKKARASSPVLFDFTCAITPYHATGNPDNNQLSFSVTPDDTDDLTTLSGAYDIELFISTTTVHRAVEGKVTISPQVTRPAA